MELKQQFMETVKNCVVWVIFLALKTKKLKVASTFIILHTGQNYVPELPVSCQNYQEFLIPTVTLTKILKLLKEVLNIYK